jgi:hypothetical protein
MTYLGTDLGEGGRKFLRNTGTDLPNYTLSYITVPLTVLVAFVGSVMCPVPLLTPYSTVLLEKLTGVQLVKKLPTFYGTRRFFTAFTSARNLFLS